MTGYSISNKRSTSKFSVFLIILLTLVAALAVSALNIFVLADESLTAEAAYSNGAAASITGWNPSGDQGRAYYYIQLGGKYHLGTGERRYDRNVTLTLNGTAGALYRNGWLQFDQKGTFTTVTHNDFGGMGMSETNGKLSWSTQWGSGNKNPSSGLIGTTAFSGSGREYQIKLNYWADDSGSFMWDPYDTDSHITPWVDVHARADSTAPYRSSITGVDSVWSTQKVLNITLYDAGAGVDPASISINGTPITGVTENGKQVSNIRYTLKTSGANNLKITCKDYLGNTATLTDTINYIDTANPYVVSQISRSTTAWTNQGVTLTATVKDTQSGINNFTLAGSSASYAVGTTTNVTRSVVVQSNGTYNGTFTDHVGKTGSLTSVTVSNIDKIKPDINNVYFDPKWVSSGTVRLYIRATDAASGINSVKIQPKNKPLATATAGSGTANGFTYTHYYDMPASNGQIEYEVIAYDNAGNDSIKLDANNNPIKTIITPNIDTVDPVMGTPVLSGTLKNGNAVNASTTYSFSNISVSVTCSDVGSGIWKMTLNGVTLTQIGATSFSFPNVITANTINIGSYVITVYDQSGRTSTKTINPKKDSTTPGVSAIGLNEWQKGGTQTVQASVWLGLSGGEVQMKRTYLGGASGNGVNAAITPNWKTYGVGTSMYSGTTPVYQTLNQSVSQEGEEYYHFRIISGTGVDTGWRGIGGANETAATMTKSGVSWTFASNGARTRIDNTAPELTAVEYKNSETTILPAQFGDLNNYLAESFDGHFSINDGIKVGSERTDGLNCSGVVAWNTTNVRVIVTYEDPLDGGAIKTHRDSNKTIIDNGGFNAIYNSKQTIASFKNAFTNAGLPADGKKRTLAYRIIVTDNVGNSSELTVTPYIDDVQPLIDIASAKELREGSEVDYDFFTPQNWTYNNIKFYLTKAFGPSGATVRWYINPNKGTGVPSADSPLWSDDSNDGWGTIADDPNTTTASIEIPKRSFDATIFFMIVSKARRADGSLVVWRLAQKEVPLLTNFYIAVDRDKPTIDRYEFTDTNGNIIKSDDWSPTNVKLTVYAKDESAGGIAGSGVKNVVVKIKTTGDPIPMEVDSLDPNKWSSVDELLSNVYYILIRDNVDQPSEDKPAYNTFAPNIDTKIPEMTVTATNSYNLIRGGYGTGSYVEAQPTNTQITINISSAGSPLTIKSGATLYRSKRNIDAFTALNGRYTLTNELNKTTITVPIDTEVWKTLATVGENGKFSLIPENVGIDGEVEHFAYDFLIVSGSGLMYHVEYGTVYVDMQAPVLNISKIQYIKEDLTSAQNLIPPPGGDGEWTNSVVTARLYIEDVGSGVNSSQVRLNYFDTKIGQNVSLAPPPEAIEVDERGVGFYSYLLDSYIDYTVSYVDNAGNEGEYTVKPLIDIQQPTISLTAFRSDGISYNINPGATGGVTYINKDITIIITLNYGVSSFKHDDENFYKGDESYHLKYSTNGMDYVDMKVAMGSASEWTSEYGDTLRWNWHNRSVAEYELILTNGQNRAHYFQVWNGVEEGNDIETRPTYGVPLDTGGSPYAAVVKIDKDAPVLLGMEYNYKNIPYDPANPVDLNNWTDQSIEVSFILDDKQEGSGVLHDTEYQGDERRSVMLVIRSAKDANQPILEKIPLSLNNGRYSFEMNGYFHYYIEYEDVTGNGKKNDRYGIIENGAVTGKPGGISAPITPLIDSEQPRFNIDTEFNKKIVATSNSIEYNHNWTYNDVTLMMNTFVGISGQKLQYRLKQSDLESVPWGAWQNVSPPEGTDYDVSFDGKVDPLPSDNYKITKKIFNKNLDTGYYQFQIVSGAGVVSELLTFGWIRIDKVTPTIAVTARTPGNVTYVQNTWTKDTVTFTIDVSRCDSGTTIEVSIDGTNWSNGSGEIGTLQNATALQGVLSVQRTTNVPLQYYFRVRSGAGLSAANSRLEFEGGEWKSKPGFGFVKIDKVIPSLTYSFARIAENGVVYSSPGQINYSNTWDGGQPVSLGSWTFGYVMMRLVSNVGPSGAKLSYSDEVDSETGLAIFKDTATTPAQTAENGWTFNGVDVFNKNVTNESGISYILLREDRNSTFRLSLLSNSGISNIIPVSDNEGNVMIDNTIPYMKVNISSSGKSVKWEDDSVNDLHKWYTSAPTLTFTVGRVVGGVPEYVAPVSGASIFTRYTYTDGGNVITTEWTKNGVSTPPGQNPFYVVGHNASAVRTYEFKIVSGAGKEMYLTQEYAVASNYEGKGLWIKNLTGDTPGYYTIKVDTTEYKINIEQWLKEYRSGLNQQILPGVITTDMAQLSVIFNDEETPRSGEVITEQTLTLYKAKRGDSVAVTILPNTYTAQNGYGYLLKRTEYLATEFDEATTAYIINAKTLKRGREEQENSMSFNFEIYNADYAIKSYFTKVIDIEYLNTYQVKQTNELVAVEVTSNNKAVEELQFTITFDGISYDPLPITYDESTTQPTQVGKYDMVVSLANDNPSDPNYEIHNPDIESLKIVYFKNYGTEAEPQFNVNNAVDNVNKAVDLGYINIYNDPDARYNFLGEGRLEAEYRQTADIEIGADYSPIYGVFTGEYDGGNFELYATAIAADGGFGIFEAVDGTIKNLGVRLQKLTVSNATNVGFIAGAALEGATVTNCYAIGELIVSGEGASGEGASIGGLIGKVNSALLNNNYSDVAMSNKGAAISGTIGGLLGLVENSTVRFGYAIGAIEVYGIDAGMLKAGTLIGSLVSVMNGGNNFLRNKYLSGNLFINDSAVQNSGAGYIDPQVSYGEDYGVYDLEGLLFNRFVVQGSHDGAPDPTDIARTAIASSTDISKKYIMNLALGRISELGMTKGNGTAGDPFEVTNKEALAFIDKYVWAHYEQKDDFSLGEFKTIAAHKVFSGSYNGQESKEIDGEYVTITHSINDVVMNSTDKNTGIFGRVSGTIKNVDVRGLDIKVAYGGSENAFVGGIAAILLPGARLEMVYVLGNITASAPNAVLRIGGIAGYADNAALIDLLSIANVKTNNTLSADVGGTIGYIKDSTLRKVYSLARVEGSYSGTGSVGAISGTMTGTTAANMVDYFAIIGNTYAHGQSYDYLAGYAPGSSIELGVENANFMTFEQLRGSSLRFETDGNKELDTLLDEIYPLEGKGTLNNPFRVYTTADFAYINDFLYANYRIKSNLSFGIGEFKTIGVGSKFTGTISAAMTNEEYNNAGGTGPRNYRITGMTNALVYHNAGTIRDIRLDIAFNETRNTDTVIGTVAIYNSGTIQGVTAEGHIILRVTGSRMAIVGGFVGHDLGGTITQSGTHAQDPSYELSSINGVILSVSGSQINAGGFVGRITGPTLLSYLISNGDIICNGGSVTAGTIAGAVLSTGMVFENEIDSNAVVLVNGVDNTKQYGFYIVG